MKKLILSSIAGLTLFAASGCGMNNFRDVEGTKSQDADSYTLWNNVDGNPNIVRVCADGIAFVTTTREYGDAIKRVPEWDKVCEGVKK